MLISIENLFKTLFASKLFKDAVQKIDSNINAYNAALNDLNLALITGMQVMVGRTAGSMEQVHNTIHSLPQQVVDTLTERYMINMPTFKFFALLHCEVDF